MPGFEYAFKSTAKGVLKSSKRMTFVPGDKLQLQNKMDPREALSMSLESHYPRKAEDGCYSKAPVMNSKGLK